MIFANQTACQLRIDGQNTPQNIVDTFIVYSQAAARNLHFLLFRVSV